jgi:protein-S-isoprenylcysteine O-methyltransferase Ste14
VVERSRGAAGGKRWDFCVTLWAMSVNAFFAQTVRLQTERGHTVVTDGPYAYVRHPGYVGMLACMLGACFLLGSLWALVPWLLYLAATVVRTELEDRTLHAELSGYPDYARRTRYRLIPLIW